MSYAVKTGTVEAVWIGDGPTPAGHVRFDGDPAGLVWGDDIGNLRAPNAAEALTAAQNAKLAEIRATAKVQIESQYPAWRQTNAALGLLPQAYVDAMSALITAVIAASNTAENAVAAATTVAEVDGVTPVWP